MRCIERCVLIAYEGDFVRKVLAGEMKPFNIAKNAN